MSPHVVGRVRDRRVGLRCSLISQIPGVDDENRSYVGSSRGLVPVPSLRPTTVITTTVHHPRRTYVVPGQPGRLYVVVDSTYEYVLHICRDLNRSHDVVVTPVGRRLHGPQPRSREPPRRETRVGPNVGSKGSVGAPCPLSRRTPDSGER